MDRRPRERRAMAQRGCLIALLLIGLLGSTSYQADGQALRAGQPADSRLMGSSRAVARRISWSIATLIVARGHFLFPPTRPRHDLGHRVFHHRALEEIRVEGRMQLGGVGEDEGPEIVWRDQLVFD